MRQLNDDKHRKLEQILDTTQYLQKICGNVKDNPQEAKFRRVRCLVDSRSMQLVFRADSHERCE